MSKLSENPFKVLNNVDSFTVAGGSGVEQTARGQFHNAKCQRLVEVAIS